MAWEQFGDIVREAIDEQRAERDGRPVACPNDGEPLTEGPQGILFCKFDGWREGGQC